MLPINDELHINDFECKVFPNPTSEILNIEILGLTTNASGMILTILGEKQMDFTVTGKSQLNISSLAEGIYVLQLIANGKTTAIKFIKTK